MITQAEAKEQIIHLLDSLGLNDGGYKVTLELWGGQKFDCPFDVCPEASTGHKHSPKLEFARLSSKYAGEKA